MTRLWLPFGRRVLVLIVLLVALVALFPLRLAIAMLGLDAQGVTARHVSGSVWGGRLEELNLAGVSLGTVDASLAPLDLFIGRARIDIQRTAAATGQGPLKGAIVVSRNTLGVRDVDADLPLAAALVPLPVGGVVLSGFGVRFDGAACTSAIGSVRATLTGSLGGIALAQGLSGNAACDGRFLRLPLTSASGRERLDFRLTADGEYIADLIAVEPDADRVAALAALGFSAVPGGYRLRVTGQF